MGLIRKAAAHFGWFLAGLAVCCVLIRIAFGLWLAHPTVGGDAAAFREMAANLTHGKGLTANYLGLGDRPTAEHPPLLPFVLAGGDLIGLSSLTAQRILLSVVSAAGVVFVGLLGRRLCGPAVGLLAASIATFHPLWIQPSGVVMSESIVLVVIPIMLYVAVRAYDDGALWWSVLLGVLIGLAVLARSEAILLVVLLGLPLAWIAQPGWRRWGAAGALTMVGLAVVLGPWLVRNATTMDALKLSTNTGNTFAGSYCDEALAPGPRYGGYVVTCAYQATASALKTAPPDGLAEWTPPKMDDRLTSLALSNARRHPSRVVAVIPVRVLRLWGFWDPPNATRADINEGRHPVLERVGLGVHYVLVALAVLWLVEMPRRARRRWLALLAPVVMVSVVAAVLYGSTRMRVAAEPSLAVAAAAGVAVAHRLVVTRRSRAA